jgi:hypothetical protein
MASAFANITSSNLFGLETKTTYQFDCSITKKNGQDVQQSKSRLMTGMMEMVLNQRFQGVDASTIWQAILAAKNSNNATPSGITYIVMTKKGGKPANYIGKTNNDMGTRYKAGPKTGGIFVAFDLYDPREIMDVTLYCTSNPALLEGWCFNYAETLKIPLVNLIDPS